MRAFIYLLASDTKRDLDEIGLRMKTCVFLQSENLTGINLKKKNEQMSTIIYSIFINKIINFHPYIWEIPVLINAVNTDLTHMYICIGSNITIPGLD